MKRTVTAIAAFIAGRFPCTKAGPQPGALNNAALDPFEAPIREFLSTRKRASMMELLETCLQLPQERWILSERRRIGKVMRSPGWIRPIEVDRKRWYFAAPECADPSSGDGRFRQCAICGGYFGRPYYAKDVTPCPCGGCEPVEQCQPSPSEKSRQHDLALQRLRTGPSPRPERESTCHSRIAKRPAPPAAEDSCDESAQDARQNFCLPAESGEVRPCAPPYKKLKDSANPAQFD